MKVSIEWLKDYTDIDVNLKDLAEMLTMTGSKVETIETKGENIKNVVIGKILEIEKHPDADKLIVTKVNVGSEILQIVTGAKNVNVGDIIPVAKNGAELPGGVKIKTGALRGVESQGMMCSIGELELTLADFPNQIEDGIMIFPKHFESLLGQNVVDVLKLKEEIIEFEITPNRPDCLSVEGLGRETAITLGKKFKNPRINLENLEPKNEIEGLKVDIKDKDLCYRYIARVVKNVKIGPSPDWMVRRLKAAGIRSINNIVDITNYVMLELGQPMHAFDINSIDGKHIIVRRAQNEEQITTLDGVIHKLDDSMLVIADEKKAVAVAGVMGGENSEIEENTITVVFESAVFNGGNIRLTAKKLGMRTESSARYEKGLPQENALRCINRAVQLVKELNAGEEINGAIDIYPTKQVKKEVEFNPDRINNLLGTNISKNEMEEILSKLGFEINNNKVVPPMFRQDIEGEADLAEEILRIYGYDKLDTSLMCANTTLGEKTKLQKIQDNLLHFLANTGFNEIYTYSFYNAKELNKVNLKQDSPLIKEQIQLLNPLNDDYTTMRTTMIPGMLQSLSFNNAKKNKDVCLFEMARVYKNKNNIISEDKLPEEDNMLTIGMYGSNVDFYVLKGIVENILDITNIKKYEVQKEETNTIYHPGRTANIMIGKDIIATFGEVHPIVADNYDIKEKVYVAEISIDKLTRYSKESKKYVPVPKFPAVERDLSLIVDNDIESATIEKLIIKKAKDILEDVQLFDMYKSDKLGENKKSLAYSLKFRSSERTLTDGEIETTINEILKALSEFGAELRK